MVAPSYEQIQQQDCLNTKLTQLTHPGYDLHTLGWKSFQDLSLAVAEECLKRPVQSFLASNDSGRDGAFLGRWKSNNPGAGTSTIQCKLNLLQIDGHL
jgi:hypothetical protein